MTDVPLSSPAVPSVSPSGNELVYLSVPGSPNTDGKCTTAQIAALAGSPAPVVLNGSVAGHAYVYLMTNQTTNKWYRVIFIGWNDVGQTYTWPTAFADFVAFLANIFPAASSSNTVLTLPSTGGVINGVVDAVGA